MRFKTTVKTARKQQQQQQQQRKMKKKESTWWQSHLPRKNKKIVCARVCAMFTLSEKNLSFSRFNKENVRKNRNCSQEKSTHTHTHTHTRR
jgi:hypothetical protein